jgi:hypothetical protein
VTLLFSLQKCWGGQNSTFKFLVVERRNSCV